MCKPEQGFYQSAKPEAITPERQVFEDSWANTLCIDGESDIEHAFRVHLATIDSHLRAAEPVGWQYFHNDLWHLSESEEPWRSKGMPVREVFIRSSEDGRLPKEPPLGLLVSMAIRSDHGLSVPGYYDQSFLGGKKGDHALRMRSKIS